MEKEFNETEYKKEFNKKTYDSMSLYLPKGEKDIFKEYAKKKNISLTSLVRSAVFEKMDREP